MFALKNSLFCVALFFGLPWLCVRSRGFDEVVVLAIFAILVVASSVAEYASNYMNEHSTYSLFVDTENGAYNTTDATSVQVGGANGTLSSSERAPNFSGSLSKNQVDLAQQQYATQEHGYLWRMAMAFSLLTNIPKLMSGPSKSAPQLHHMHGVRAISMFWVILGHTFLFCLLANVTDNIADMPRLVGRFGFQIVGNAYFSVDTFFFLSGFLLAYLAIPELEKKKGQSAGKQAAFWGMFYLHRYLRLTPTLVVVILLNTFVLPHMGDGPIWAGVSGPEDPCKKHWWSNLLYINNFYPAKFSDQCVSWTWYLANDMQFFIISPVILLALIWFRALGFGVLIAMLLACFASVGGVIGYYNLSVSITLGLAGISDKKGDYGSLVYEKPYCRITPYLVGIFIGYVLAEEKRFNVRRSLSWFVALGGWVVASAIAMAVVFGLYSNFHGEQFTTFENVVYGMFAPFGWALALAWVVYSCFYGYGGYIGTFLGWRGWAPIARLTYCAYLVHPLILTIYYSNMQTPIHYTDNLMVFWFAAIVVIAYLAAAILCLLVEFPMAGLEKAIFQPPKKQRPAAADPQLTASASYNAAVTLRQHSQTLTPN